MSQWPRIGHFEIDGIHFRVVTEDEANSRKRKNAGHMVLEIWVGNRWIPVPMAVGFMMADFWWHEEEFLYPQAQGYLGGDMYMSACWEAVRYGWRQAQRKLAEAREAKSSRTRRSVG